MLTALRSDRRGVRAITAGLAVAASTLATTAHAQASGPPLPAKPAIVVVPQPPSSLPPSTVAPARVSGAQRGPVAPATPVRAAGAASVSPDSVRPRPVPAPAVTPLANQRQANPPRAAATPARASAAVPSARPSVLPSAAQPAGATMRCKDGSYLVGPSSDASCADRGGVAVKFATAPARPRG